MEKKQIESLDKKDLLIKTGLILQIVGSGMGILFNFVMLLHDELIKYVLFWASNNDYYPTISNYDKKGGINFIDYDFYKIWVVIRTTFISILISLIMCNIISIIFSSLSLKNRNKKYVLISIIFAFFNILSLFGAIIIIVRWNQIIKKEKHNEKIRK